MSFVKDLDAPLLRLSPCDVYTLREACTGIHAFGAVGSGKSSGLFRMAFAAYLRAGMGGLVTAAKPESVSEAQRYAAQHGRGRSVILFDESEGFNFLDYLMAVHGMEGIGSATECLMAVIDAARRASATASHRGGEIFWEDSTRETLRYTIPPLYAAIGSVSIPDIIRFVSTAPASGKQATDAEWQKSSFMYGVMKRAMGCPKVAMSGAALRNTIRFWTERWVASPEKTRGNVVVTVNTTLDRFNHGRLNRAFCGKTTVVPELTFHGAVIVLAMPTLTWGVDGIIGQQLLKFLWMKSILSRNSLEEKHRERPVFIFSDEAQETVAPYDQEFFGMSRASLCCPVYLTQSLPTYFAKIGGDNPKDAALALVSKFNTHVYFSNACPETNEYASRMIGKVVTRRANFSNGSAENINFGMSAGNSENSGSSFSHGMSTGGQGGSVNTGGGSSSGSGNNWGENRGRGTSRNESRGYSESMEYAIEPGDFGRGMLKTGGPENGNEVTGVWFRAGRVFKASGTNWLLARFRQ
jgi:uncharacterized membrane protein YgcG